MTQKTALITGITGQDGAYLADLLLEKGYLIYGAFRRVSSINFWRLKELGIYDHPHLHLVEFDLTDLSSCLNLIENTQPSEIYNLAAQSFVKASFDQPIATAHITGLGTLHLLEAIRLLNKKIRFYQASTSEMFGGLHSIPQDENTLFYPRSPYGVAKLYAHWITINYRESYDIFACSGILFNHESPLRGLEFVTRKITDSVARIKLGKASCLELGNIDAQRDWGFAKDYVVGIWKMLQIENSDTYVLATQRTESIRHFLKLSFQYADIQAEFSGEGVDEIAIDKKTNKVIMRINPKFYRPAEVHLLVGNSMKAKKILGWEAKTNLEDLCRLMIEADIQRVSSEKKPSL